MRGCIKAFIAGGAVLAASPAIARISHKPVSCIYDGVAHNRVIDSDKVDALLVNGQQAKDNDDKMVMQMIGKQVAYCRSKYGWNDKRQSAAVSYMRARLLYDSQRDVLKAHDITYEMIDSVASGMTPDVKQIYLGGTVNGDMLNEVIGKLRTAGATIDDASAADRDFLLSLDRALIATLTETASEEAFNQR